MVCEVLQLPDVIIPRDSCGLCSVRRTELLVAVNRTLRRNRLAQPLTQKYMANSI